MHDHLRLVLLRRIDRRTLSVSLLARQTGLSKAHLSNFLRARRKLSTDALDRILVSQTLTIEDLLPATAHRHELPLEGTSISVPLVSHAMALFEPAIRSTAVKTWIHVLADLLKPAHAHEGPQSRRSWRRFVAVRIPSGDSLPMEPVVFSGAIAVIDRHCISFNRCWTDRPNLYAVRHGSHLVLRYADFLAGRLVLKPYNFRFPTEAIEIPDGDALGDFLAGRVVLILNMP
jgi:transcriptional regulator with XRE-family HTH domain